MYAGKLAKVRKSGTSTAFSAEATTASEGYTIYKITNEAKRILDRSVIPTIYKDGGEVSSGFTIDYLLGKVIFTVANGAAEVITLDGKYMPMADIADGHEYEVSFNANLIPAPVFGSEYNKNVQGDKNISGSISEWVTTEFYFVDKLIAGEMVVIELYPQADQTPIKFWAVINSDALKAAASGEQDQSVSFESDGEVSFI